MPTQNILAASRCRSLHSSENINIYLWLKKNCATPRNQNNEEVWLSFMKSNASTASCFDTEPGIVIFIELKSTQSSQQDLSGWEQSRAHWQTSRDTQWLVYSHLDTRLSLSQLFHFNYLTINLTGIKWGPEETLETSKTLRAFLIIFCQPWNSN